MHQSIIFRTNGSISKKNNENQHMPGSTLIIAVLFTSLGQW